MTAGYSGTPLPKKLGIREGLTVGLIAAPDDFRETLGELPDGVDLHSSLRSSDIFVAFAATRDQMERRYGRAMILIPPEGAIWVAWPKKSYGVETDLT
jgi:hypothetical protein